MTTIPWLEEEWGTSIFVRIKDGRIHYYDRCGHHREEHAFIDCDKERARLCAIARCLGRTVLFCTGASND